MMEECSDDLGGDEGPVKVVDHDHDPIKQPEIVSTAATETVTHDIASINTEANEYDTAMNTVSDNSAEMANNENPVICNSVDKVKPVFSNGDDTLKPVLSNGEDTVKPVIINNDDSLKLVISNSDTVQASDINTATDPSVKTTDSNNIPISKTSIVHSIIETVIKVAKNEEIIDTAINKTHDINTNKVITLETSSNNDKATIELGVSDETKLTSVIMGPASNDDDLELGSTDSNAANMNNNNVSAGLSVADLERQNGELLDSIEEQKRVIELLRMELTKKDESIVDTQSKLQANDQQASRDLAKVQEESAKKFAELRKAYEHANKEKESAVMKYAMGESNIIVAKKGKEVAEKKLLEANKDKEGLNYKIKTLSTERTRLQGLCDVRGQETIAAKREGEKWREECRMTETKLNNITTKMNTEVEAHRETKESLDRTLAQLAEIQGSVDKVKNEYLDMIKEGKEKEKSMKRVEKEQEVKLMIDNVAAQELENLRKKYRSLVEENNQLSVKVQAGEKERLSLDSSLSESKETLQKQKAEILDMYSKCAELESTKLQLDKEIEKCNSRDTEITRLRSEAKEIQSDMTSCRAKEADLLDFTQKLTDKNVNLQSEYSSLESRVQTLEVENSRLSKLLASAEKRANELEASSSQQVSQLSSQKESLEAELNSRNKEFGSANQQSVDAQNEVEVLRRQHAARIRELTKELNAAKRRLEEGRGESGSPVALSHSSRTSSNTSLNRPDYHPDTHSSPHLLKPVSSPRFTAPLSPSSISLNSNPDHDVQELNQLPDIQVMIEKIVKLQKSCAKRQEKVDFLEEHVEQLLSEVKKKNRIIQHYAMNLQSGALISEESDVHKGVITQQGGIMSSIYGSKVKDSGMTLELSLEMNKKLQTVLEDTLLKNIFLKENINTLGMEIQNIKSVHKADS